CGLADGMNALRDNGIAVSRVLLIGGASRSRAVRAVAAGLFGVPVEVPEPAEYVALGAARQAAWVLSGAATPPAWHSPPEPRAAARLAGFFAGASAPGRVEGRYVRPTLSSVDAPGCQVVIHGPVPSLGSMMPASSQV